jgi:hypothetical protein
VGIKWGMDGEGGNIPANFPKSMIAAPSSAQSIVNQKTNQRRKNEEENDKTTINNGDKKVTKTHGLCGDVGRPWRDICYILFHIFNNTHFCFTFIINSFDTLCCCFIDYLSAFSR